MQAHLPWAAPSAPDLQLNTLPFKYMCVRGGCVGVKHTPPRKWEEAYGPKCRFQSPKTLLHSDHHSPKPKGFSLEELITAVTKYWFGDLSSQYQSPHLDREPRPV